MNAAALMIAAADGYARRLRTIVTVKLMLT